MRLTTGGKNGFGSVGKTDAEIEEMAGRVQLSPADRFFLKRMDELMRTKGLKLLKEAGL